MNKKIIFLDIDGTFRDPFYGTPESAIAAVKKAKDNSHSIIICTGRAIGLIPDDIDKSLFDGFICGGGCYIKYKDEIILDKEYSTDVILNICDKLQENNISHRLEAKYNVYMTPDLADKLEFLGCTDDMNSEIRQMTAKNNKFDFKYSINDYRKSPVPVTKICTLSTINEFEKVEKYMSDFHIIKHTDTKNNLLNTEIVQKDCDKGNGIKRLCEFISADIKDTIAFGDSMNDCEMFSVASVKAAMSNGDPKLIALADIVCPHIMKDGLYEGFKKANLI